MTGAVGRVIPETSFYCSFKGGKSSLLPSWNHQIGTSSMLWRLECCTLSEWPRDERECRRTYHSTATAVESISPCSFSGCKAVVILLGHPDITQPCSSEPSASATFSFLLNSDNLPIDPVYLKLFKTDFYSLQPRTSRILGCPPKAVHCPSVRGATSGKSSGPSLWDQDADKLSGSSVFAAVFFWVPEKMLAE